MGFFSSIFNTLFVIAIVAILVSYYIYLSSTQQARLACPGVPAFHTWLMGTISQLQN